MNICCIRMCACENNKVKRKSARYAKEKQKTWHKCALKDTLERNPLICVSSRYVSAELSRYTYQLYTKIKLVRINYRQSHFTENI